MSKQHFNIFKKIINNVESKYIKNWKYNEKSFTRKRKLPPKVLILQILSNKGRTAKMEIKDFYQEYKLNGNVSVWGYEKRRLEFNPLMIHEMNSDFLKDIYKDNDCLLKFNDYLILAVDGSDIKIPSTKTNYEKYGKEIRKSVNPESEPCLASISCIYDCLNKYTLDCQINKYKYSERLSASENINNAKKIISNKSIYVFDRGYVSFDLFYKLRKDKFVFRIQKRHFKKEQEEMISDDELFKDVFNRERRFERYSKDLKKLNKMRTTPIDLRFVRIHIDSGDEYLVTNLTAEEASIEQIGEIYNMRWGIESSYRTMKSQLKMEEFSGYLPVIIEQDIFSCVLMYNLIISNVNDHYLPKNPERYKYKMKVNLNYSIGIIKTIFVKILLSKKKEQEKYMDELQKEINKYCLPVRTNRTYERKRNVKNKCSMSYKYSY